MHAVKGLAWDDKPEEYMYMLRKCLADLEIDLEVEDDHGVFLKKFNPGSYDFVVLDLFRDSGPRFSEVGKKLAARVHEGAHDKPWFPIFIMTGFLERLRPEHFDDLPTDVLLRYKADPVFVAMLIKEDLTRRGVFISRRKVFLIRHTDHPDGIAVEEWLKAKPRSLGVEFVAPGTLATGITQGLRKKMNDCGGIVAVCTPDEKLSEGEWRTRPNIVLEIGMAMGLTRGLDRLVIVKQMGVERPSNLGDILTLDYKQKADEVFPVLEQRLALIGVDLTGESTVSHGTVS